ncbi:hypothetical protein J6590_038402 [Homalodisca vitripennis]|nr:hypothetical protein J6590_038402 [Homalodisca vitripennis]
MRSGKLYKPTGSLESKKFGTHWCCRNPRGVTGNSRDKKHRLLVVHDSLDRIRLSQSARFLVSLSKYGDYRTPMAFRDQAGRSATLRLRVERDNVVSTSESRWPSGLGRRALDLKIVISTIDLYCIDSPLYSYYLMPMAQCSGYKGYRQITRSSNVKRGCLLRWVTAERFYPCKQSACPAVSGGSEVTFKPFPRLY